jgi:O-methyltransferase involved in polyketide biosynthesis
MSDLDTSRISPTAHYTAYVWVRHGLSHPALASPQGRLYHAILAPANFAYDRLLGRPNLEAMLLARHRVLDHLLARAIETGAVRQVIEIAAGLSPRGYQLARRYPAVRFIEGDLPESAALKRRLLDGAGLGGANHEVVTVNALLDDGPGSLAEVCAGLPAVGTAIVTEGLLGYFDLDAVTGMWRRFARALRGRGGGLYLCDLNLGGDATAAARAFRHALSWFARGEVHLHFDGPDAAAAALRAAGFDAAEIRRPSEFADVDVPRRFDGHQVRIGVARVG